MKRSANTTSAIREIRKKRPAFTLVELIVVITILAVLATAGFLALSGYTKDAKDSTLKTNVRTVAQAVGLEAVTTDQSMRRFATFSGAYAMSGKVLGTVLSGGTVGTVGTNYTPGPVDFAALRMDASKLTADGTKYVMSAVDVPETLATGKTRTRSFFQVGAIDGTKTYVEGTLSPSSVTGSETDVSGIIADPTAGSNTALASNVDGSPPCSYDQCLSNDYYVIHSDNSAYANGCATAGLPNAKAKCILKIMPDGVYVSPGATDTAGVHWNYGAYPTGCNASTDATCDLVKNLVGATPATSGNAYAVYYCNNLNTPMPSGTGYGKWHLPPMGANGLTSMYSNNTKILRHDSGTVNTQWTAYWSSNVWSWNGASNFWFYVQLNNGTNAYASNSNTYRVRCVAK